MTGQTVGVTGRVIFFRNTGKLCFATLREGDAELQVMLSRDRVGEDSLAAWKADIDLGDHVLVTGEVGTSRGGNCRYSPTPGNWPRSRCGHCRWRTSR